MELRRELSCFSIIINLLSGNSCIFTVIVPKLDRARDATLIDVATCNELKG